MTSSPSSSSSWLIVHLQTENSRRYSQSVIKNTGCSRSRAARLRAPQLRYVYCDIAAQSSARTRRTFQRRRIHESQSLNKNVFKRFLVCGCVCAWRIVRFYKSIPSSRVRVSVRERTLAKLGPRHSLGVS